jgi:glutaminase
MDLDVADVQHTVSTGSLPGQERVEQLVADAFGRYHQFSAGEVATYIPVLAQADPSLFGICVAAVDGRVHLVGAGEHGFSIQSISKAFVYALACDAIGHEAVLERVGVDSTGLPFNSVMAIELHDGHPMNPMVNAGALVTTSMIPGTSNQDRWAHIQDGLSRFAGRRLELDPATYESESATNHRNRAIARLMESYGRIDDDPLEVVETYTKQCSLEVTARDLAVMGATLAHGGVNPVTGERVVRAEVCRDTLAVLATAGLYERSGEWLFEIGLPGKSGVSGGIVAVAPGKGAVGTFSPPLDAAGNSVRGVRAIAFLARSLGLDVFASATADA